MNHLLNFTSYSVLNEMLFQCDMWSLGVILYILLSGGPPFNPNIKDPPLLRQITQGIYSFPILEWSEISLEAVDLVKKLVSLGYVNFKIEEI